MLRLVAAALVLTFVASSGYAMVLRPRPQVRRARADMRSLSFALESYHLDHGAYPPSSASPEWQIPLSTLTSPVAHLDFEPVDPFKQTRWVPRRFPFLFHVAVFLLSWGTLMLLALATASATWTIGRRTLGGGKPFGESVGETMRTVSWIMAYIALVIVVAMPGRAPEAATRRNRDWAERPPGLLYWTDGADSWILQSLGPDGDRDLEDLSTVNLEGHVPVVLKRLAPFAYDPTNGTASSGDLFRVDQ